MKSWQLQEAKSRLSELIDKAVTTGPQMITKRGVETVVVLSVGEYRKLGKPKKHVVDVVLGSPLRGVDLELERNQDTGREISL